MSFNSQEPYYACHKLGVNDYCAQPGKDFCAIEIEAACAAVSIFPQLAYYPLVVATGAFALRFLVGRIPLQGHPTALAAQRLSRNALYGVGGIAGAVGVTALIFAPMMVINSLTLYAAKVTGIIKI